MTTSAAFWPQRECSYVSHFGPYDTLRNHLSIVYVLTVNNIVLFWQWFSNGFELKIIALIPGGIFAENSVLKILVHDSDPRFYEDINDFRPLAKSPVF